jgi:hypothetical protein
VLVLRSMCVCVCVLRVCVCVSRVPTTYDSDSGVLTIKHTPECDACQYAYFAPYTYNRHRTMIARMQVRTLTGVQTSQARIAAMLHDAAV